MNYIVKIQVILFILALLVASSLMSFQELRYQLSGTTVDAEFLETHVQRGQGPWDTWRVAGYAFQDGDAYRREYAKVPMDWTNNGAKTVKVEYLAGHDRQSRLLGQTNRAWMGVLFLSITIVALLIAWMVRSRRVDPENLQDPGHTPEGGSFWLYRK